MTYLNCLRIFNPTESDLTNVKQLEFKNNIILPPIFKMFIQTFDIEIVDSALLPYYSSLHPFLCGFGQINNPFNHQIIYDLFAFDEILKNMKSVYRTDDEIWEMDLLPFGEVPNQGYLMVGFGESNKDQIFVEYAHREPRIEKIGENVIAFLNSIEITPDLTCLPNGTLLTDLYKNWGEDFWRIRPNEADGGIAEKGAPQ